MTQSKSLNIVIALLIGILMNPFLFAIVFFVDSAGGNVADSGAKGTLLERTPFAYVYFWAGAFLPDNPAYTEAELLLAVIGNTILYATLSYIVLSRLGSSGNNLK
jgi:hypothetical protein